MSLNPFRSFGTRAAALATAGVLAANAMGLFAASAQQQQQTALTEKQCSDAISIANAVVQSHKGKLSKELIDSFVKFGKSNCDLNTDWKLMGRTDEQAFGEFRVRLVALRSADAGKPQTLAKR